MIKKLIDTNARRTKSITITETNPNSTEKPNYPYELEVDWMSYEPFKIK